MLAGVAVAEIALAIAMRVAPVEWGRQLAAAVPIVGLLVLLALVVRARPSIGETALAAGCRRRVRRRAGVGVWRSPRRCRRTAGPGAEDDDETIVVGEGSSSVRPRPASCGASAATPLGRLRTIEPGLFRPRLAVRPALVALVAGVLLIPAVLLPNPQDAVIAPNRQVREEAQRQAQRIDEVAEELETKGADAERPADAPAKELRELADSCAIEPGRARR